MQDLNRFLKAQEKDYQTALNEIKNGRKHSHWIWYIFPQIRGLGSSYNSTYYGIADVSEAEKYLENPVLAERLTEITQALLCLDETDPVKIMGSIDAKKLKSSMTLFAYVSDDDSIFQKVLDKFFSGEMDELTLRII